MVCGVLVGVRGYGWVWLGLIWVGVDMDVGWWTLDLESRVVCVGVGVGSVCEGCMDAGCW
jgi:hypothetical protein